MIPGFVTIIVIEVSYVWQKKNSFGPKCHGCVFFCSVRTRQAWLCPCVDPLWSQPYLDPIPDFCLCQQKWYASDATEIMEHPSIDSCHQSCDSYIHYRGPTRLLWVDHPADELVQLTNSYTSWVKNMISISSDQFHQAIARINQYEDVRNEN